jgi:hypothetical protein
LIEHRLAGRHDGRIRDGLHPLIDHPLERGADRARVSRR